MVRQCCVPTCLPSHTGVMLHTFPNPEVELSRYLYWTAVSGNSEIQSQDPRSVYLWRQICHNHFEERFIIQNNRLRPDALPTLLLPVEIHLEEDMNNGQELDQEQICSTPPRSEASFEEDFNGPSTSTFGQEADDEKINECGALLRSNASLQQNIYGPSTSKQQSNMALYSLATPSQSRKATLLQSVNIRRAVELTPKAKIMYKEAVQLKRQLRRAKIGNASYRKRLQYAENVSNAEIFKQSTSTMKEIVSRFFKSQLENATKKPHGKRFSDDDKVLALALFKQSGPAYKLLSKIFSLPSRQTLTKLLNRVPMQPGINEHIFEVLKSERSKNSKTGKYCILMFDEMSICPNFSYDQKEDIIRGFEDFGDRRTEQIANHVQVFMLRNIEAKWKQPIYYNFIKGATDNTEIQRILKLLIGKLAKIGLIVCATVCDQGPNNSAAITKLVKDTTADYIRRGQEIRGRFFEVAGIRVIPLFDPPHLLKCIRNNLLNKDMKCTIDGIDLIAKWDHINTAYLIDSQFGRMRMMPRLTTAHVDPKHVQKMKVSICTQVLSQRVASALTIITTKNITGGANGEIKLEAEASQTATVVEFFDDLFDSVNGHVTFDVVGKKLRTCVTDKSPHIEFWKRAIKILKSMKYIDRDVKDDENEKDDENKKSRKPKKQKTEYRPPTLQNWIHTLEGFLNLYTTMKGYGFKNMFPRTFNQDPLENFFGKIRQRGVRFTNPTVAAFTPFYTSLLVNNLSKDHSKGSNCENDEHDGDILVSLKRFLQQKTIDPVQPVLRSNGNIQIPEIFEKTRDLEAMVLHYVSGFVSKKVLPKVKNCESCKRNILAGEEDNSVDKAIRVFTEGREYDEKRRLKYCSAKFIEYLTNIYNIFNHVFSNVCYLGNVLQRITEIIKENVQFPFISDCGHNENMENLVIKSFIRILLFHNIKTLNNIMLGKDRRNLDKACCIYKNAAEVYKKSYRK